MIREKMAGFSELSFVLLFLLAFAWSFLAIGPGEEVVGAGAILELEAPLDRPRTTLGTQFPSCMVSFCLFEYGVVCHLRSTHGNLHDLQRAYPAMGQEAYHLEAVPSRSSPDR